MPLKKVCSREALQANIAQLRTEGHSAYQSIAIAFRVLKKECGCPGDSRAVKLNDVLACKAKRQKLAGGRRRRKSKR